MKLQLTVPDMACSACAENITKAIQAIDVNATVQGDPQTKIVTVETETNQTVITSAISNAGYTVS
jgi:copper chaperone